MPPKSKKLSSGNNKDKLLHEDIAAKAVALLNLKERLKPLTAYQKQLEAPLREYADIYGEKDGKGNYSKIVTHGNRHVKLQYTKRTTSQQKSDAIEVAERLFKNRPDVLSMLVEEVKVFRIENVEHLLLTEQITKAEAKKLVETIEGYAFNTVEVKNIAEQEDINDGDILQEDW